MARRTQQGSVAHCPYCEASLPRVAAECPTCRFPLTLAAADFGSRAPRHSGTSSTATPIGRIIPSLRPPGPGDAAQTRAHGSRAHRMRVTAWLLGVTAILLVLAGIGAAFTAVSPGAISDREATANLLTALHRVTDNPKYRPEATITILAPDQASSLPNEVSVDQANGLWFAAARSTSGSCFLLAGQLPKGTAVGRGTLGKKEPCTAAEVRLRSEPTLSKPGP